MRASVCLTSDSLLCLLDFSSPISGTMPDDHGEALLHYFFEPFMSLKRNCIDGIEWNSLIWVNALIR